jgi:hypothetical protein
VFGSSFAERSSERGLSLNHVRAGRSEFRSRAFRASVRPMMFWRLLPLLLLATGTTRAQQPTVQLPQQVSVNDVVLAQMRKMPGGGKYQTSRLALIRLQSATNFESGKFFVVPEGAAPSYCSGATYLVFVKTIEELRKRGQLELPYDGLMSLIVRGQKDGEGIWGRWNANGPGTARLFHELRLGRNFTTYEEAQPGDFMKIFWSTEVGKSERGHSVIYLGLETKNGEEYVRFWSSNKPDGYGEKSVPRKQVVQAIFSRLETPANLANVTSIPASDPYLASLLTVRSSFAEAKKKLSIRDTSTP